MLRVRMLGAFELELDGARLALPESRRAWSLLAWLALHPGMHARGRVAAQFWPDVLDSSARASLRSAIWSLRRALGATGERVLLASRDEVGLEPREVWTDVAEFGRLVDRGRLEEAVALGRGELLPGFEDGWAHEARDEQREGLAAALGRLAAAAENSGNLATAVGWTRRRLRLDPLSEETHRDLIRRLAASGDRAAALAAYARTRERLRQELGIAPSLATRQLVDSLRHQPEAPRPEPEPVGGDRPPGLLPMIGRDAQTAELLAAWRAARGGSGGVVTIGGEAGIGKTRLVLELAAAARFDGARVATCAALGLGAAPFLLWAELLRDLCRDLDAPPPEARWPSELARLAPNLEGRFRRSPSAPAGASPELERTRLFESAVELVEWATRERPLLIVIEDLHVADTPSVELAGYVGRRLAALPLLMVLTRRDLPRRPEADALEHALRARNLLARELTLGPLPGEAIAVLARTAAPLSDSQVGRVVDAADGNALLAVESARALARGERSVPASLRGTVRPGFHALTPEARSLAAFAAVAARDLERHEIEALPIESLTDAATSAIESGLLVSDRGRIGYRHALLREAVYEDLPEPYRASLHETFAAALQGRDDPTARRRAAEVAQHLRRAGRDEAAVEHLVRAAADARAVAAMREAAAFLEEALRVTADDPAPLLELAEVEAWRGRRDAAESAFERAAALIDSRDLQAQAEASLRRGRWMRGALCYPREARDSYRRALELLDAAGLAAVDERVEAVAGLAWAEAVAGDADAVDGLLSELDAAVPRSSRDDLMTHDIEAARSFSLVRRGRFEESYGPAVVAAEAAEHAGRPDMAYSCWKNASSAAACAGDFDKALAFAERGLTATRGVLPPVEVHLHAARAHVLARLGRLDEARAAAETELEIAERLDSVELRATALHDRGLVAFAAGEDELAERLLEAALEAGAPVSRPPVRLARAEALIRLGRLEDAERQLRATALEPVATRDFPDTLVPRLTRIQGLIAAARGDRELAERYLQEAADGWRRRAGPELRGDQYVATLADLGRPPVAGLVEPARELDRVMADLESLRATPAPTR
jgi:DNA-binding SARP family transcriptional activator